MRDLNCFPKPPLRGEAPAFSWDRRGPPSLSQDSPVYPISDFETYPVHGANPPYDSISEKFGQAGSEPLPGPARGEQLPEIEEPQLHCGRASRALSPSPDGRAHFVDLLWPMFEVWAELWRVALGREDSLPDKIWPLQ